MVQLALAFIVAAFLSVQASPFLEKRISQTVDQSLSLWQKACVAACGSQHLNCNVLAVAAYNTLLAAATPCAQQNAADGFITFAKQQCNANPEMIFLSQIFCMQPRNSPTSLSVPYCQSPPSNPELKGLYQCQFVGVNPTEFVGGLQVGAAGTIPLGKKTPVSPPGSCPANPAGPIPAGTQLVSMIPDASSRNAVTSYPSGPQAGPTPTFSSTGTLSSPTAGSGSTVTFPSSVASPTTGANQKSSANQKDLAAVSTSMSASAASSTAAMIAANQQQAQKLNQNFASLTTDSPCTDGTNACVKEAFAQCVGSKYVLTPCSSGLACFALPLLLKSGTSIACDTQQDAVARGAIPG